MTYFGQPAPPKTRAYTYKVTVKPVNLAVSLATFKAHIKVTNANQDTLLTLYLEAAIDHAEHCMNRDLITRTYETFRDFFPVFGQSEDYYGGSIPAFNTSSITNFDGNLGWELRRSPLQSVTSVEYLVSNVLTTVSTDVYYNTIHDDYSQVLALDAQQWPNNADNRYQVVKITFKTGFGDDDTDIPSDIQRAILGHATSLYVNRGDCDSSGCASSVPSASKSIYMKNRLLNL